MINFFYNHSEFSLENKLQFKLWIERCLENYELEMGEVSYTFVNDDELLEINKEIFDHDFYTDIITIDQRVGDVVSADIFISVDRVRENAKNLKQSFENEIKRIIIHGLLHIVGFNDHTDEEKQEMREQEDYCIEMFED
jgi:rRNA maturation RNase YbeY